MEVFFDAPGTLSVVFVLAVSRALFVVFVLDPA